MGKSQFYEQLAYYYDLLCGDRKQDVAALLQIIRRHQKPTGKTLLDVACGTGLEDKYLKTHFAVTGIDLHEGVLKIAKERNPDVRYLARDMRNFRLRKGFDVITCFDALCYLRSHAELRRTLRNFRDHLTEGGLLIFYIDHTFLRECRTQKVNVIVDRQSRDDLTVTLTMTYRERRGVIEGQDTFAVTRKGRTEIFEEPKGTLGLFSVRRILGILEDLGFTVHTYATGSRATFTLRSYVKGGSCPVFVCVQGRSS